MRRIIINNYQLALQKFSIPKICSQDDPSVSAVPSDSYPHCKGGIRFASCASSWNIGRRWKKIMQNGSARASL